MDRSADNRIHRIELKNVKLFEHLVWQLPDDQKPEGWHVLIGDNGAGKSTLLRTVALALLGLDNAKVLRLNLGRWVRWGKKRAALDIVFADGSSQQYRFDKTGKIIVGRGGWGKLSSGYGPFRRFGGGEGDQERQLRRSYADVFRHVTLFDEQWTLEDAVPWLQKLHHRSLTNKTSNLQQVLAFINQEGFLPHGVRLDGDDISDEGVLFTDGSGAKLEFSDLSDGYRSILCLTLDLLRHFLTEARRPFSKDGHRILTPAVVLIDEVDVHLHPTWQRSLGPFLRSVFPRIQFLVTSHSPLVCQAATHGTVFRLPPPSTSEKGMMLKGAVLDRLLYGDIGEAFSTGAFGDGVTRSEAGRKRLERLALLNRKARRKKLTPKEVKERGRLRAAIKDLQGE